MATLTRHRSDNPNQETWHVYFGDVRIGAIGERAGVPLHAEQWSWDVGFYPGTEPHQHRHGTAGTFDDARAAFEQAWCQLQPTLTEANYETWREQRDSKAWVRRMHAEGLLLPTQTRDDQARCFCGEMVSNRSSVDHVRIAHRGIGA